MYHQYLYLDIFCDSQDGFRSKWSCCWVHVVNDFAKALNSGDQTDALFLDFSTAFDEVLHLSKNLIMA